MEKKIYMQFGDKEQEHERSIAQKGFEFAKDEGKDFMKDEALETATDSLTEGVEMVEILDISGGMVSLTMPLAMVTMLSKLFKNLELDLEQYQGQGVER